MRELLKVDLVSCYIEYAYDNEIAYNNFIHLSRFGVTNFLSCDISGTIYVPLIFLILIVGEQVMNGRWSCKQETGDNFFN